MAEELRERVADELEEWESNGGGNFAVEATIVIALIAAEYEARLLSWIGVATDVWHAIGLDVGVGDDLPGAVKQRLEAVEARAAQAERDAANDRMHLEAETHRAEQADVRLTLLRSAYATLEKTWQAAEAQALAAAQPPKDSRDMSLPNR